ncbi:probable 28S ribosomal protein S23, mitochondrial [Penaeus monodon]|uniref:probable 28S ribosomal protein S23, mitochondrial n=1 Tax=Penaeus monodon TaxID=6687 RepID=UPI0018A6EF3D|nr:probable 28S ribosomal protein S23, mitochondrial [Penaeus monodon]
MAGNRLEKIGTIFTRTTGLLKSGAIKASEKPLWYEVYEAFPPKYEPHFDRPVQEKKIKQILYTEDVIRAKFYKAHGSPGTISLSEHSVRPIISQLFIKEYEKLKDEGNVPEEKLMEETALALEAHGIYLDRSRAPPKPEPEQPSVETQPREPQSQLLTDKVRLSDIFKESQEEKN